MRRVFLTICLAITAVIVNAQIYSTKTAEVSFFSKTPVEDISAVTTSALAVMNNKGELAFSIANTSFNFPNKLMQEHFNEKYMESEKFPTSTFKGKINESVDFTKNGEYDVTVTGKLNIHGVEQERTIPGKLIVKDNEVQIATDFKVKNVDHKITIPKLVVAKIAEEIQVSVKANLPAKSN